LLITKNIKAKRMILERDRQHGLCIHNSPISRHLYTFSKQQQSLKSKYILVNYNPNLTTWAIHLSLWHVKTLWLVAIIHWSLVKMDPNNFRLDFYHISFALLICNIFSSLK
jgi:hypothetical protein